MVKHIMLEKGNNTRKLEQCIRNSIDFNANSYMELRRKCMFYGVITQLVYQNQTYKRRLVPFFIFMHIVYITYQCSSCWIVLQ